MQVQILKGTNQIGGVFITHNQQEHTAKVRKRN